MSETEQVQLFLRFLLALGLGAVIGFEREWRGHEAGIRTSALVVAGAAVFGEVSIAFGDSRVAAGVVQGIGFLGAGLIFKRGDSVSGVTTAAMTWALAGIGLLIAEDLWLSAVLVSAALVVLLELSPVSDLVYRHGRRHRGEPDVASAEDREPPNERRPGNGLRV